MPTSEVFSRDVVVCPSGNVIDEFRVEAPCESDRVIRCQLLYKTSQTDRMTGHKDLTNLYLLQALLCSRHKIKGLYVHLPIDLLSFI